MTTRTIRSEFGTNQNPKCHSASSSSLFSTVLCVFFFFSCCLKNFDRLKKIRLAAAVAENFQMDNSRADQKKRGLGWGGLYLLPRRERSLRRSPRVMESESLAKHIKLRLVGRRYQLYSSYYHVQPTICIFILHNNEGRLSLSLSSSLFFFFFINTNLPAGRERTIYLLVYKKRISYPFPCCKRQSSSTGSTLGRRDGRPVFYSC